MRDPPRLFVDRPLARGEAFEPGEAAFHYLAKVMRLVADDPVTLFDDRTGEWRASVSLLKKKSLALVPTELIRPRETVPDLWLCAAPIARQRFEWVAEKACELGIARLVPVITERTQQGERLRPEKLRAHMIEAAEQCGRTALPTLGPPVTLATLLAGWEPARALVFADEAGGGEALSILRAATAPAAILIGPEGGFSDAERAAVRAVAAARAVTLGPRVLRADTAAVAAVALWQAAAA